MNTRNHLDEDMQTTCLFCSSLFRISQQQLDQAHGKARCGVCGEVFNALLTLENYQGEPTQALRDEGPVENGIDIRVQPDDLDPPREHTVPERHAERSDAADKPAQDEEAPVSLQAAMYGEQAAQRRNRAWLWGLGILALLLLAVVQTVYYLRYQLIADPDYQQQVLNLCRLLPCDPQRFHSPQQVRLTERNVFTHPTREQALMITGRFVNDAPFPQSPPRLRISLSDLQGNLIANRLFTPGEYLVDPSIKQLEPGKSVPFRLEIFDPDEKALTYEFEFVS